VEPLVLYLLKKRGKTHGYELVGALQEHALTDSTVEPGALYRALRRLEANSFVVSDWDASGAGPARRVYELTPAGEEHLLEWMVVLDHLAKSMTRFVAETAELVGAAPPSQSS
jgi:DNA-binding PadR family transcriptional regulator